MARACKVLWSVLLLTLLSLGPAGLTIAPVDCTRCHSDCPMHAHRLGCHSKGARMPCHGSGGLRLVSASCGHGDSATPMQSWRALPPRIDGARLLVVVSRWLPAPGPFVTEPVLEPPTRPPRVLLLSA